MQQHNLPLKGTMEPLQPVAACSRLPLELVCCSVAPCVFPRATAPLVTPSMHLLQITGAAQRRVSPFSNAALPAGLQDLGRPASTPPTLQLHTSQPISQLGPGPLPAGSKSSADCLGPLGADPARSTDPGNASNAAGENIPEMEVYPMDVSFSPAQQPPQLPQLEAASSEGDLLRPSSGLKGQGAPDMGRSHAAGGIPLPGTQAGLLPEQPSQFPGQLLGREATQQLGRPAAGGLYSGAMPGPQSVLAQARQQPPRRVSEFAAHLTLEHGASVAGMQGQHGQAHSHQMLAGLPQGQHMHMPGLQQPALHGGSYLQQLPQHLPSSSGQQPLALQQGMMLSPHSSPSSQQVRAAWSCQAGPNTVAGGHRHDPGGTSELLQVSLSVMLPSLITICLPCRQV